MRRARNSSQIALMIAYTCKTEATVFFSLLGFKATRAAFSSLLAHKRAECRTTAKLISSTSWMCVSCSQKRKKRLRLFRYPRMVFGVYFLTSISIKYSLIAALVFMSIATLVCRNQRGMYITAQSMYFAAGKKSVPKTRCIAENQILFRRKSSINPAASYARRSARPHCHPACPDRKSVV